MIAALTSLEKWAKGVIHELDTEGRAEYERLVGELKAEAAADLAKIRTLAADLETGLEQAVQAAGPSVTAAVKAETGKFLAGLAPLLSEAAHDM
jgi:hypothetical protein